MRLMRVLVSTSIFNWLIVLATTDKKRNVLHLGVPRGTSHLVFSSTRSRKTVWKKSLLCGDWLCWNCKTIKIVVLYLTLFQLQLDRSSQIWYTWCSLNHVRGHFRWKKRYGRRLTWKIRITVVVTRKGPQWNCINRENNESTCDIEKNEES